MELRRFSLLVGIGAVALIYFLAGKFGLHLAYLHASASPVWPPTGIAIAVLLVFGYRLWPGIFIGAFLVNATGAGNMLTSLAIAGGNTLEAASAAWLINRFANGTSVFDRYQDVFRFAVLAFIATIVSPTVGVTALAVGGFAPWPEYAAIWITWLLGDFSGAVIFTPVILLWIKDPRRHPNPSRDWEVALLLGLLTFLMAEGDIFEHVAMKTNPSG